MLEEYEEVFFPFLEKIKEEENPTIQEGTIFAIRFCEKYCFGKVMCMQAKIPGISKENMVVCFSNELSNDLNKYPKKISMQNLLLGPLFIREIFWKKGICYTVDHIPLTKEEREMDIGFFDSHNKEKIKRYSFSGQEISYNPQILTPCIESALEDVEKELITELMLKELL